MTPTLLLTLTEAGGGGGGGGGRVAWLPRAGAPSGLTLTLTLAQSLSLSLALALTQAHLAAELSRAHAESLDEKGDPRHQGPESREEARTGSTGSPDQARAGAHKEVPHEALEEVQAASLEP